MALKNLKETAKNIPNEIDAVINSNIEYYKLYLFRLLAKIAVGVVTLFTIGLLTMIALFFLANALAFAIGERIDSLSLGFLIIGIIICISIVCMYKYRKKIIYKPILEILSKIYFTK